MDQFPHDDVPSERAEGADRVRFTSTFDVFPDTDSPDGYEARVEVVADVDADEELELREAVTFIEPTLAELKSAWPDRIIDLLIEDACAAASRQRRLERLQTEESRALAGVLMGLGGVV